jgi:hypothetical protein
VDPHFSRAVRSWKTGELSKDIEKELPLRLFENPKWVCLEKGKEDEKSSSRNESVVKKVQGFGKHSHGSFKSSLCNTIECAVVREEKMSLFGKGKGKRKEKLPK